MVYVFFHFCFSRFIGTFVKRDTSRTVKEVIDSYLWGRLQFVNSTSINTRDKLINRVVEAIDELQREAIRKATIIEVANMVL